MREQFAADGHADTLLHFQNNIEQAKLKNDSALLGRHYFDLGQFCYNAFYLKRAITCFKEAERILSKQADKRLLADCLNILGTTQSIAGHLKPAQQTQHKNLQVSRIIDDPLLISRALGRVALLKYYLSENDSSFYYFNRAIEIAEAENSEKSLAPLYNNRAMLYDEIGDYAKAWADYSRCYSLLEKRNDEKNMASCMNNMAIILENQGNFEGATEYYFRAISLAEKSQRQDRVARYQSNLGYVYEVQGLYKKALDIQKNVWPLIRN